MEDATGSIQKAQIPVPQAVHKNNSVSGRPAGWLKKVRLETFFLNFAKIFFSPKKIDNIFIGKRKKLKKNCGRPTGFNFSHPLHRKHIFFMDSLRCRGHGVPTTTHLPV